MINNVFRIFVDFDGTITQKDVGESIFREFGDKEKINSIIKDLLSDKITAKQSWIEMCKTINHANINSLNTFIDSINVDPGFHNLVHFCESNNIEIFILSDGFDYYIDRILKREKLNHLKYFSNHLRISDRNKLTPVFPFNDLYCRSSANNKRNHIINNSSDEDFTIYVGDGNSDKDPALYCDFIFAKKGLLKFCEKESVSFFPYNTLDDVAVKLDMLLKKKNLKKRNQASLKRREAYLTE
jgi:2,3-diketo-5-methylthio-1-phosphopentane phosphatase